MLQLNYWRGPIDAWPLSQNIRGGEGAPPGSTPLPKSPRIVDLLGSFFAADAACFCAAVSRAVRIRCVDFMPPFAISHRLSC